MNRQELIAAAHDAGWTVTGHRWLRMSRGDMVIDAWYAGSTPRMVSAAILSPTGGSRRLDIVHDFASALPEIVLSWLAPAPPRVDLLRLPTGPTAPRIGDVNGRVAGNVALSA